MSTFCQTDKSLKKNIQVAEIENNCLINHYEKVNWDIKKNNLTLYT